MSVQKITFTDKQQLNANASISAINKCQAVDMNEIKSVVNNNADELTNAFKYSTTESVVGTWIDDKPIYRQVFTQSNTNNISNVATNNENIIKMECYVRRTGTNAWRSLPWLFVSSNTYGGASWAGGFYFNNNTINFQLGSDLSSIDKLIFIIEYTKITD